jgi:hypothetical protein
MLDKEPRPLEEGLVVMPEVYSLQRPLELLRL